MSKPPMWIALSLLPFMGIPASADETIHCAVTLVEYLPATIYRELVNSRVVTHSVPIATFVVASPIEFFERRIRVAFLSSRYDHLQFSFQKGAGARFMLEIPVDHFDYMNDRTLMSDRVGQISPLN